MDKFTVEDSMPHRLRRTQGATRGWALTRKMVLAVSLALACQSALAQAMYRMTLLREFGGCSGGPTAAGFNASDHVAVESCNGQGGQEAFLWKNDGNPAMALGPPEAQSQSFAAGINTSGVAGGDAIDSTGQFGFTSSGNGAPMNRVYDGLGGDTVWVSALNDLGQLTGTAVTGTGGQRAFLWKNDGSPMVNLGTLGGASSAGYAINAAGQVAGQALGPAENHAFIWKNDGHPMHDLGTLGGTDSIALAMNASGQITGTSTLPATKNTGSHAFFWGNNGTPMQDLGTLGADYAYSYPTGINQAGQIAGYSYTKGSGKTHAFVWLNNGTTMKDLGTFGGTNSRASDINAAGQVVGWANFDLSSPTIWHAFLWKNDGTKIQDLNTLIDPADPLKAYVTVTKAHFINRRGDIVADGTDIRTFHQGLYLLHGTVLTLTPRSLAFGNHPIHTTSAAKPVTLTNTGPKAMPITSVALTGTASGQFASTDNCASSLPSHMSCTIQVTFKPTTKGAKSAWLTVNGGDHGLLSVKLSGTGT